MKIVCVPLILVIVSLVGCSNIKYINNSSIVYVYNTSSLDECNKNYESTRRDYLLMQQEYMNLNVKLTNLKHGVKTDFRSYNNYLSGWERYYNEDRKDYSRYSICAKFNLVYVEDTYTAIENYMFLNFKNDTSKAERYPVVQKAFSSMTGDCTEKALIYNDLFRCNGIPSRVVHGEREGKEHDFVEVLYPYDYWVYWRPVEDEGYTKTGDGIA